MSTDELDNNMELILASLPEYHSPAEKRKHALTRQDAELIASMIKVAAKHQPCSLQINQEQAVALLKVAPVADSLVKIIVERRRFLAAVGAIVIGVLVIVGERYISLFGREFWAKLFHH